MHSVLDLLLKLSAALPNMLSAVRAGRAFDTPAKGLHYANYTIDVSYVPGDHHCTPGQPAPCYDEEGVVQTCLSNTTYRRDELNMTTFCQVAPSSAACGSTTVSSTCTCPQCKPFASYPCGCPGNAPDGTLDCLASGEAFAQCDCDRHFPYPALPPPASPPPPSSSGGLSGPIWAAIGGGSAVLILAAVGTPLYLARKRSQTSQAILQAGLLNADSQAESASAPYVTAPVAAQPSAA